MPRANLSTAVVIAAAADMADRDGLETVTISALARHFGVQPASLYSHVQHRAAVLDGVQTLALGELADRIADATVGRSGRDALVGLADAQRTYARQSPGRWAALPRRAAPSTALSESAGRLVTLMWAVLRGYRIADDELVHASRMLGATINGFITLETAGSFDYRDPATETSWRRCLAALDSVLATWSTSAAEQHAD